MTILEKLQAKYANVEGISAARNIAEAVGLINGIDGRGAGAIADYIYKQFTISFDLNGGSGTTPASVTKAEGLVIALPDGTGLTPAVGKEELLGWGDAADATAYSMTHEVTEDVTLYAIWGDKFTITYDANGGTGTIDAVTVSEGTSVTLSDGADLTAPEDKEFAGWGSTALAEEADIESPYTVTEDVTLYAVWADAEEPAEPAEPAEP